jgi:hypothetical protein
MPALVVRPLAQPPVDGRARAFPALNRRGALNISVMRLVGVTMLAATVWLTGPPSLAGQDAAQTAAESPAPAQAMPPAPPSRPPMRVGTGLILGRVVDGQTTTAVPDALVTLTGGGAALKVLTDAEGRFLFTKLPDGPLSIGASKAGYASGRYGQRSPRGPGRVLTLAAGARVGDAVVRLWKLAAISGVVQDEAGDPAVGVEVRLIDRLVTDDGERVLAPGAAAVAMTDDRGMYRFAAVSPGEYVVLARSPSDMAMRVLMSLAMADQSAIAAVAQRAAAAAGHIENLVDIDSTLRIVAPTFYGGAGPGGAQPIRVRAGEERRGIDVRVAAVAVARVAGTLLEDGAPVGMARVRLTAGDSEIDVATATSDQTGRFVMMGVPAGVYTLRATRDLRAQNAQNAMMTATGRPATPAQPTVWARQQVVAGSSEATSLTIAMRPGPKIRGRVEFRGGATRPLPEELAQLRVSVVPPPTSPGTGAIAQVQPDGTFETAGLAPARYRLSVMPMSSVRPWQPVSALAGAIDLLDQPVELDADLEDVVIVLTSDASATIEGTVTGPQGAPDPSAVVVVLPADPDRFSSRRRRIPHTNASGAYSASNLPAGDYVVAISTDERVEYGLDREEILRLIQSGTRITIVDGDRRTVHLRSGGE